MAIFYCPLFFTLRDKIFVADEYVQDLGTTYAQVKKATRIQEKQKKAADKKHCPLHQV